MSAYVKTGVEINACRYSYFKKLFWETAGASYSNKYLGLVNLWKIYGSLHIGFIIMKNSDIILSSTKVRQTYFESEELYE